MHLAHHLDPRDHSTCTLAYDEADQWLHATWCGFVDQLEAVRGAESYLALAPQVPCALLLNDNVRLQGPWFDGLDWLADVWAPQAAALGLRYVAHVVPADGHFDVLAAAMPQPAPFELQVFQDLAAARHWLRQCHSALAAGPAPAAPARP